MCCGLFVGNQDRCLRRTTERIRMENAYYIGSIEENALLGKAEG